MRTLFLRIDPVHPDPAVIEVAAAVIRDGGLVAFPTETVYGLGANALDAAAVARIFNAKGRPATNPVIVHLAAAEDVGTVATDWPTSATLTARLAGAFWPGPLTMVLPKRPAVPDVVTAGGPTVAVRVPSAPVALALLRAAGVPIAAPSANRSSELSPTRADHVARSLDGLVDIILDGGPTTGGLESTVVDLFSDPPRLLRPGPITPAEIEAVIGPLARTGHSGPAAESDSTVRSPGLLARHYAPRAVLECVSGPWPGAGLSRAVALTRAQLRVGWLSAATTTAPAGVRVARLPADPAGYGAGLYAALHDLDAAGVDRIVADFPPDGDAWLAVRDRLRRAATPADAV